MAGKSKRKEDKTNEIGEIYIPPEKDSKLLMTQDCLRHIIKMEYQKITNLLRNVPDKVPKFITKKWTEVYDQSGNADNI